MALNPLVSLIGRLVAHSGRKRGNGQVDGRTDDGRNDKPSTIILAVHARRGLIKLLIPKSCFCQLQCGYSSAGSATMYNGCHMCIHDTCVYVLVRLAHVVDLLILCCLLMPTSYTGMLLVSSRSHNTGE